MPWASGASTSAPARPAMRSMASPLSAAGSSSMRLCSAPKPTPGNVLSSSLRSVAAGTAAGVARGGWGGGGGSGLAVGAVGACRRCRRGRRCRRCLGPRRPRVGHLLVDDDHWPVEGVHCREPVGIEDVRQATQACSRRPHRRLLQLLHHRDGLHQAAEVQAARAAAEAAEHRPHGVGHLEHHPGHVPELQDRRLPFGDLPEVLGAPVEIGHLRGRDAGAHDPHQRVRRAHAAGRPTEEQLAEHDAVHAGHDRGLLGKRERFLEQRDGLLAVLFGSVVGQMADAQQEAQLSGHLAAQERARLQERVGVPERGDGVVEVGLGARLARSGPPVPVGQRLAERDERPGLGRSGVARDVRPQRVEVLRHSYPSLTVRHGRTRPISRPRPTTPGPTAPAAASACPRG